MLKNLFILSFAFQITGMQPQTKKIAAEQPLSKQLQNAGLQKDLKARLTHYVMALPGLVPYLESKLKISPIEEVIKARDPVFVGNFAVVQLDSVGGCLKIISQTAENKSFTIPSSVPMEECGVNNQCALLAVPFNSSIYVWDLTKQSCLRQLPFKRDIEAICFDKQGLQLCVAFMRDIEVWDIATGNCLKRLQMDEEIANICFDESGTKIIIGDYTGLVTVWAEKTGLQSWRTDDYNDGVGEEFTLLDANMQGDRLVTFRKEFNFKNDQDEECDETVKVWDLTDLSRSLSWTISNELPSPRFNRKRGICAVPVSAKCVCIYSVDTGEVKSEVTFSRHMFARILLSESGQFLIAIPRLHSGKAPILFFSVDTGDLLHIVNSIPYSYNHLLINDAGNKLLAGYKEKICFYDLDLPCLRNLTFEQTLLLNLVYEINILKRLILLRTKRGESVIVESDGSSLDKNACLDLQQNLRLDLDGKYEHLRQAYNELPQDLKELVSPLVKYTPLLQEIA